MIIKNYIPRHPAVQAIQLTVPNLYAIQKFLTDRGCEPRLEHTGCITYKADKYTTVRLLPGDYLIIREFYFDKVTQARFEADYKEDVD